MARGLGWERAKALEINRPPHKRFGEKKVFKDSSELGGIWFKLYDVGRKAKKAKMTT
jgi:hypothetical protein